ncbi:MAG: efflux RND transporter permease subunit, partial [Gemmatimonadetes bacterium]|nr:efflux RND transporter permease subunit [Gemmatimonadota bacterium]
MTEPSASAISRSMRASVFLFRVVPGSFVPEEDQGYVFGINLMPDAASLDRTSAVTSRAAQIVAAHPAVQDIGQFAGYSLIDSQNKTNAAALFVSLKPFEEREDPELSAFSLLATLNRQLASIKDGMSLIINPPSIPGLGTTGGFEFYIQNRGSGDPAALDRVTREFLAKAQQRPELAGVNTLFTAASQQLYLDLDRAKAELLGVPVETA